MLFVLSEYSTKDLSQFISMTGKFECKKFLLDGNSRVIHLLSTDDKDDDYYEPENDEELNDDEPITQSEIDEITGVPEKN